MGIVNVTPDSFSDGGRHFDASDALAAALAMVDEGADIIDIGGESTRPGAEPVTAAEELRRVVPVIEALRSRSDVVISIDTTKAEVAQAAVEAGADIVNDVSGGVFEPALLEVVARTGAGVVLTHTPARPSEMLAWEHYDDVVATVVDALGARLAAADAAGIPRTHVALDPGFGFGKNAAQNMALLRRLDAVVALHPVVLAGVSRKRMIREHVGTDAWRLEHGTTAAHALALAAGAAVVRTHDVAAGRACAQVVAGWRDAGGAG